MKKSNSMENKKGKKKLEEDVKLSFNFCIFLQDEMKIRSELLNCTRIFNSI